MWCEGVLCRSMCFHQERFGARLKKRSSLVAFIEMVHGDVSMAKQATIPHVMFQLKMEFNDVLVVAPSKYGGVRWLQPTVAGS